MEKMVQELKERIALKDNTSPGDLVLVAFEESKSVLYALVTDISPDTSRREEWWQLTMQLLGLPPQQVIWTLREPQFTGKEIFTMDGYGRFVQALNFTVVKPGPKASSMGAGKPRPTLKRVK